MNLFYFLNSVNPTIKGIKINKKVAFVVVKKLPVVLKGNISNKNNIVKVSKIFFSKN
jgi:hypothetical protein